MTVSHTEIAAVQALKEEVICINPKYYGKRPILSAFDIVSALNRDETRCFYNGKYYIYLNVGEYNTMLGRAVGTFEPRKFALIERLLQPGHVFFDLGANKGDFTLLAAGLVGASGHAFCFEPHPDNVGWIDRSIRKNGFTNVTLVDACVSDSPGSIVLYIGQKSGWHTIHPKAGREQITCRAVTIDQIVQEKKLSRVDLMKIDIEGAEVKALAGARNTIAAFRPPMLIDVHSVIGASGYSYLFNLCTETDYLLVNDKSLKPARTAKTVGHSAILVPREKWSEIRKAADTSGKANKIAFSLLNSVLRLSRRKK